MAQNSMNTPTNVVERNLALTRAIMQYLLSQPQVFDSLPDKFELIILPEDAPEMRLYNLDLLDHYGAGNRAIVFARIKAHQEMASLQFKPSLFVPVAA